MSTAPAALPPADQSTVLRTQGLALVVTAAVLWSSGGLVFRLIESAGPWQVIFWRSISLVPVLFILITVKSHMRPMAAFREAGWAAPLAGMFLGLAFATWILALKETTVANAVFVLACAPVAAALLGRIFLGERLTRASFISMAGVFAGLAIMTSGAAEGGRLAGNLLALATAFGFAGYTVTVRARRAVDMTPAVLFAGLFSGVVAVVMTGGDLAVTTHDLLISVILGTGLIGLGLVIYTAGSRHLPAVELTLLSLLEVVLAPIWVWLFLAEQPSPETLAGGAVMLAAVCFPALSGLRRRRRA